MKLLHMTDEEHDIFVSLMQQIRNELQNKHDEFQNAIIVGYIELVLNFLSAFFITSVCYQNIGKLGYPHEVR